MNVTEFIRENADPVKLLEYYGFREIREYDGEIRACCEIHGGDNPDAFVWNKRNNLWYCYTGDCGGGDAIELVRKMENLTFVRACIKAAEIIGIDIKNMEFEPPDELMAEQKKWIRKQERKKVNADMCEYVLPTTEYTESCETFTRFTPDILKFYEAKFCRRYRTADRVLNDKLVIPIKADGITVGAALRDTTGKAAPKWLYMPKGLKFSYILYNLDRFRELINKTEEVIVTEGIFDVWAFHRIGIDNAVCVFGSTVSKQQYEKLMKLNVTVTLCFDNDDAGRKCTEKAETMFRDKNELKHIQLPEGCDPCDIPAKDLLSAYLKRKRI